MLQNWLIKPEEMNHKQLIQQQLTQASARFVFAAIGFLYLYLHTESFQDYRVSYISFTVFYFLFNLISIPVIKKRQLLFIRLLFLPILDVTAVSFSMLVDGGISSGLYLLFFIIILGNAVRFGNNMLLYTQTISLIALISVVILSSQSQHIPLDSILLTWKIIALIVIPLYSYLIEKKVDAAHKRQIEAEQSSFQLIDKGPIPIFTYDLDSHGTARILYANRAMESLFLKDGICLTGTPIANLVLEDDAQEMVQYCQQSYQQQNKQNNCTYIRGKNRSGDIIKLMATAMRMRWREQWIGACFLLDITKREALQTELDRVYRQGYLSTLVAGIVHDFRNILTNMIGYAEMLHMNSKDTQERQQIDEIINAGERGSDLITHLLKMSQTNAKKTTTVAHISGTEIAHSIDNIIGLARLQLPQNIQLISKISPSLPNIDISIIEIEQILLNLINNSTQAINENGAIHVAVHPSSNTPLAPEGQRALCLQVSDNGKGILDTDIQQIFKPFWSSRTHEGGTGLGLAMVQRIVKLHHGSIEVASTPKGTTFTIYFSPSSHQQKDLDTKKQQQPTQTEAAEISPSHHILLVDDMPGVLKVHQAMLKHLGHTIITATSGEEAHARFIKQETPFDLIITDYRMPGMSGLELVEAIRTSKEGKQVPIMVVTAFGEDQELQKLNQYNNTMIINKPVSLDKFQKSIQQSTSGACK